MKYLTIFIFLVVSLCAHAQNSQDQLEQAIEKTALQYQMDEAQKSSLRVLMTRRYEAIKKLEVLKTNGEEYSSKAREVMNDYNTDFVAMLTDKQLELHRMYQSMSPDLKRANQGAVLRQGESIDNPTKTNK